MNVPADVIARAVADSGCTCDELWFAVAWYVGTAASYFCVFCVAAIAMWPTPRACLLLFGQLLNLLFALQARANVDSTHACAVRYGFDGSDTHDEPYYNPHAFLAVDLQAFVYFALAATDTVLRSSRPATQLVFAAIVAAVTLAFFWFHAWWQIGLSVGAGIGTYLVHRYFLLSLQKRFPGLPFFDV